MENLNNVCYEETHELIFQDAAAPRKNKKIIIFCAILFTLAVVLVCFFVFYGQNVSVSVEVGKKIYSTYNRPYYYGETLEQEKDNWEYRLYCDDKLIASKKSSDNSVIFYDVKVKKGARLRAEMCPLNKGNILDKEITISKEHWDFITKNRTERATRYGGEVKGIGDSAWSAIKDKNGKIVISIKCN